MFVQNPPFNGTELSLISEPLDKQGWKQRNTAGIRHRYFTDKKGRVVNLTVEYPFEPPTRIRKNFYLFRARFGLIASLGVIKEEFVKKLFTYWAQKMKEIDAVFEQLDLAGRLKALDMSPDIKNRVKVDFVDKLPETDEDKDENMYYERVRIFLAAQKYTLDFATCKKVAATLKDLKIEPVGRLDGIFAFQDGISPNFVDRLLVFKNPDYDELVLLEPGFLTYYRDIEIENVRMRIMFDSYAIDPLINIWKLDIADLLKEIITGARAALAACINATGIAEFTKVYFIKKNFDTYMKTYLKLFDPNRNADLKELAFPIPSAWHELLHTQNLVQPPWNLFTKPPETFEELHARQVYMESQKQGKQGNLSEMISHLSQTLVTFNKSGQRYAFYLTIVELARIAVRVGNYPECKAKYDLAMDYAIKSDGLVMPDEIMKLQEEYAEACVKFVDYDNAVRQYTLLFNYLERARPETDSKRIDVLLKLNKIFINRNDFAALDYEIQRYFKQIKDFADKQKDKFITAAYYRVYGLYYEKKGKFSDAMAAYRRAMDEAASAGAIETELEAIMELGKNYLSGKKKNFEAAQKVLERGNAIVGKTDDLVKELKIYEMLEDLYNQMNNYQLAGHYNKESQRLRMALKSRGML